MALSVARSGRTLEVTALLSTVNADADRVAMHAVRRELLEAQADRLGLGLFTVDIPASCSSELYESRMAEAIALARGRTASPGSSSVTCSSATCALIEKTISPEPASRRSSPFGTDRRTCSPKR